MHRFLRLAFGLVLLVAADLLAGSGRALGSSATTPPLVHVHGEHGSARALELALDEVELLWTGAPRRSATPPSLSANSTVRRMDRAGAVIGVVGVTTVADLVAHARALRASNPGSAIHLVLYEPGQRRGPRTRRLLGDIVVVTLENGTTRREHATDPLATLEVAQSLGRAPGVTRAEPVASMPYVGRRLQQKVARKLAKPGKPYGEPAQAQQFFVMKRLPPGASGLPIERYFQAREQMKAMPLHSTRAQALLPPVKALGMDFVTAAATFESWTPLGPGNIGGRTRALIIDPSNPNIMFAGGVAGGVWKTTDSGASWTTATDTLLPNIAITSLAMDPTNPTVVYAGTGEGFFNGDAVRGAGIFKTADGGTTWSQLSATSTSDFFYVNKLVAVSPTLLLAATRTGIWRSTDTGASWTRIVNGTAVNGCMDIATSSVYILASCGTFAQGTVYRSTDGGATFTSVLAPGVSGRTSVAIAPANVNIAYALVSSQACTSGDACEALRAVHRSDDGGVTWTVVTAGGPSANLNTLLLTNPVFAVGCPGVAVAFFNQGWYDNVIAVDPADVTGMRVWAGGIDLFRSDNGGASWGHASHWWADPLTSYVHADQHAIVFHPQYNGTTNQTMLIGNDGGVFKTTNARAATVTSTTGTPSTCDPPDESTDAGFVRWSDLNNGYGVTQFYQGLPYPGADGGNTVFGGTQDNGTIHGTAAAGNDGWVEIWGGDGGYVAVDPTNTNVLYVENTGISIRKSTDGGATFVRATTGIVDNGFLFIAPFLMDPSNSQRLWTGGWFMWRTANGAASWTRGSALTCGEGSVSAIAVAAANPDRVLAGMSDGCINRTTIGTTSVATTVWAVSTPRAGYVSWVAFHPTDESIVYATYATFGGVHVWRSIDGGATWSGIDGSGSTGIPDVPVHSIVIDPINPSRLYVGTDVGVFVSRDEGSSWAVENTGFANVITESLALGQVGGVPHVFAFTHGRGVWRVPASDALPTVTLGVTDSPMAEGGGSAVITATLSAISSQDVTVNLTFSGTATISADYTRSNTVITILAGDLSGTMTVEATQDAIDEADETIVVGIDSVTNAAAAGVPVTAMISDDDEAPTVTLAVTDTPMSEAAGRATVTATLSAVTSQDVTVTLTFSGTATLSADYTRSAAFITIPAGSLTGSITLTAVQDVIDELDEAVVVAIASVSNGIAAGGTVTAVIVDDEATPTVTLEVTGTISEGSTATLAATLSAISGLPVTVQLTFSGSATLATDYTRSHAFFLIPAGSLTGKIALAAVQDTIDEPDETIVVAIASVTNAIASGGPVTATITDDDPTPTVMLAVNGISMAEGGARVVAAGLSGLSDRAVTVNLAFSGTATLAADYTRSSTRIVIPAGSLSGTMTLTAVQDSIDEVNETVVVAIASATNASPIGSPIIITLLDDDAAPLVALGVSGSPMAEAAGIVIVTATLSGRSSRTVTVNLAFSGNATLTADYTRSSTTIIIPAGSLSGTMTLTAVQDSIDEGTETIAVAIASVINGTSAGTAVTVRITDDDAPPTVTLRLGTTLIEEGDSAVLTATLSARSGRDVTVNLAFSGTAALTADYTRDGTRIIIPAGSLSRTIALTAVPDAIDEVNERVVVGIASVVNATAAGSPVTLTIVDVNPTPTVRLRVSGGAMVEAGGTAIVTATLSGRSSRAVTVNLAFSGTATLTTDYTRSSTAIIIPAGSLSRTMTLTAVPDTIDEVAETIVVRIASVTNAVAAGSPVTASITDDDVSLAVARRLGHAGDTSTR